MKKKSPAPETQETRFRQLLTVKWSLLPWKKYDLIPAWTVAKIKQKRTFFSHDVLEVVCTRTGFMVELNHQHLFSDYSDHGKALVKIARTHVEPDSISTAHSLLANY